MPDQDELRGNTHIVRSYVAPAAPPGTAHGNDTHEWQLIEVSRKAFTTLITFFFIHITSFFFLSSPTLFTFINNSIS